jgi:hypothetical protein
MVMMVAVLMLAGCDGGKPAAPAKVSSQPPVEQPVQHSTQWTIQVELKEALSDMTYWLVEHHYPSYVAKIDGKETVMIGPFDSQAAAEKAKTDIDAAMAKAHRLSQLEVVPPKG